VFFEATCARRRGRLLTKAQHDRAWVQGLLLINEQRDPELMRVVRVARLVDQTGLTKDILPPLHDAQVVAVRPGWWTITGFERLVEPPPGESACFQQSWFLQPVR
jgi:hypothetical protein